MSGIDISSIYEWFTNYVKLYYSTNADIQQHMRLKEDHTLRVAGYCRELAEHLGLNRSERDLAEAIGIFHDIGRFKQYTLYHTFSDHQSEDHARLGLNEIAGLTLLDGLSGQERDCLEFAVGCHNAVKIPEGATRSHRLYASIIRDADKLDIYHVLADALTAPSGEDYTPSLLASMLAGRQANYIDVKTREDAKLVRLSWIYDINYLWTLEQVLAKKYVEAILEHLAPTEETRQIERKLRSYIAEKLRAAGESSGKKQL
ncbi:MAG TPA: HD domain-containing protein [Methylomusa anaerophila]|uniref:HD domain protein n=1 Tax=Methylomusa anaerophila TaxID=1930071 RepID=A0A348AHJ1_9FIRM|nr:HD domain-containing protein [Methylomusa anaerophila]BBB90539.1 HD domain protein [Methylomusa anaerophila]HML89821.1 HD domain-containing protein [Methylomusa anaerophila]